MAVSQQSIEAHLRAYGAAQATLDAERTASLWGLPGMILGDDFVGALDSREEMARGLRGGHPLLRRLGLARVAHELVERVDLTDRLVRVRVRWLFFDTVGDLLTDGLYEYLLREDAEGLRVYVAIPLDEREKMADLLRRKGIDPAEAG
ncbi:hypothetical protein Q8791_07165 [Nocardiopsis sp. CT-R113]|uniref:SnoaL-like domain-containing protein n=1 Tax=Nocardiopsis codii TaxID=3065942 RepID=A0ABU7K4N2_9ACTN|nr:hypothetical protein [Nocardiopsis sp. CT-R113]MEE2036997.1 hypothetical protein [Nocardiopsis sp. CT-R113]